MTSAPGRNQKRTNVRTHLPPAIRRMRPAFRVLEHLAPALGARWAMRLFCTPPTNGGLRRDDRPGPGTLSTVSGPAGQQIVTESWGDGPLVYLVHGWGGWRGQIGAFVVPLVSAGHRVVAFDAPAHGESGPGDLGGARTSMREMAEALAAVIDAHGQPAAAIAHSGGSPVTCAVIRDGCRIPRVVFVAPATNPLANMHQLLSVLGAGPRTLRPMSRLAETIARRPLADYDVTTLPRHASVPTTLVIHDDHDKEVPAADGARIVEAWPEARLHRTAGLGHRRILRDEDVIERATAFVTDAGVAEARMEHRTADDG